MGQNVDLSSIDGPSLPIDEPPPRETKKTIKKKSKKKEPKEAKEVKYDITRAHFGETLEQAYNNYGVILNDFEQFTKTWTSTNMVFLVYLFDSEALKDPTDNHANMQIHNTIIKPLAKEVFGMVRFYAFDCSHPSIKNKDLRVKWNFEVCSE